MELTLDSTLESVDSGEELVLKEAQAAGFDEDDQHKIGVAVRECLVNAVVHGNRYNSRKKVLLKIDRTPERIEVLVGDEGDHFDPANLPDPLADANLLKHSGRGLLLMRAFMDDFEVRPRKPRGTEVRLVKYIGKAGQPG